jgi:hypothetical protein
MLNYGKVNEYACPNGKKSKSDHQPYYIEKKKFVKLEM